LGANVDGCIKRSPRSCGTSVPADCHETYVGHQADELGEEVVALWALLVEGAREQAARYRATN
jgi:hypothetical protein